MKRLIDKLRHEHRLQFEEYKSLLTCSEESILSYLRLQAQETAQKQFGNSVYIRGLIEVSNYCRNDCYYCGIRKSNPHVSRYRLSLEKILECCRYGYILGFRTFVLQGGESHVPNDETIANLIEIIRQNYPDCAITLSLGEKSRKD